MAEDTYESSFGETVVVYVQSQDWTSVISIKIKKNKKRFALKWFKFSRD